MGDTTPIYGDDAGMNTAMEEARRARHGLRIELQRSDARSGLIAILLACAAMLQPSALFADMIPVRHTEGLVHGFLLVLTFEGKALADGQMTQDAHGEEPFTIGSFRHKAIHYVVKVEIGGVTGFLACLMGKQPADTHIWVLGGEAPAFVKAEGPFYAGGPIWRIQLAKAGLF